MSDVITVLISLASITLMLILLFWLYQDYRVDVFRQKMFKLRDELFDEAKNGRIDFDDNAYGMLRDSMNGFIRFGHRFNLMQVILLNFLIKNENNIGKSFSDRLDENMKNYSDEQREIVKLYYLRMNFYIVEHLILSSLVLLVTIFIPALFLLEAKKHLDKTVSYFSGSLNRLDIAALANGKI